ncbi:MAG TPA: protein-methionine-sulfoxide reductase catalytic subunit MsrP, partial [Thermoanaerobaculia bacterium]|nr:protein-methionine-sulfoxide reductase catalytic subunit MsrP [Thermoanaerobaculia bacterium]
MAHLRRRRPWNIAEALATPEGVFLDRRRVLAGLGVGAAAALLPGLAACSKPEDPALLARKVRPALGSRYADLFPAPRNASYMLGDERELTAESRAASYNNFYEFTTTQDEVWKLAAGFAVEPWKIEVAGLTAAPRTLDLDDLFRRFP